jgi:uncharacterized phage protein (predicted DNA packaging)
MPMLDDVKVTLRISNAVFDVEISDLIAAARQDLKLSGVTAEKADSNTDLLIKRAIITYVKANFGWDNPDAEKLQSAYDMLKMHLSLSQEYSLFTVTFTVTSGGIALEDAVIAFNGEKKVTNANGQAVFTGVKAGQNMKYLVQLEGYADVNGEVDVEGSMTVAVSMVVS